MRTIRTSGAMCSFHVSQLTPSALHACSTLSASAGALRFRVGGIAAGRVAVGAIAARDRDPRRLANGFRAASRWVGCSIWPQLIKPGTVRSWRANFLAGPADHAEPVASITMSSRYPAVHGVDPAG